MISDLSTLDGLFNFLNPQLQEIVKIFSRSEDLDRYL